MTSGTKTLYCPIFLLACVADALMASASDVDGGQVEQHEHSTSNTELKDDFRELERKGRELELEARVHELEQKNRELELVARVRALEERNRELQAGRANLVTAKKEVAATRSEQMNSNKFVSGIQNDSPDPEVDDQCPRKLTAVCHDRYDAFCPSCACCQTCSRCKSGKYRKDPVCGAYTGYRCEYHEGNAMGLLLVVVGVLIVVAFMSVISLKKSKEFKQVVDAAGESSVESHTKQQGIIGRRPRNRRRTRGRAPDAAE